MEFRIQKNKTKNLKCILLKNIFENNYSDYNFEKKIEKIK